MRFSRDGADVKVFAPDNVNGVLHARLDVLGLEIGIVIANNCFGRDAVPDQFQHGLNGNSRACHARFSKMNFRADLDSAHVLNIYPMAVPGQGSPQGQLQLVELALGRVLSFEKHALRWRRQAASTRTMQEAPRRRRRAGLRSKMGATARLNL